MEVFQTSYIYQDNKISKEFLQGAGDILATGMLLSIDTIKKVGLYQNNIINEGGKVFLETSKHTELELSNAQDILKDKIIGDVRLIILQ